MILASFESVMDAILYIFIALLILMFMITIHELGHYLAGKIFKFKINEFSIGMGPKLFSRKNKKTNEVFSIRLIPLGGYCAFEGEDEDNASEFAFNNQKPWKRLIVLFSGAFLNFVSAVIIVIIAFSIFGNTLPQVDTSYEQHTVTEVEGVQVIVTNPNKFEKGDIVLEINGKQLYLAVDISKMIDRAPESCDVKVLRNGEEIVLTGITKSNYYYTDSNGVVKTGFGWGVSYRLGGPEVPKVNYSFGQALAKSVPYCFRTAGFVLETLGQLITGALGIDQIGGPITTIDVTSQVARTGIGNILMLITLVSVNLAVFNLLPIPALDGSRMVFVIIEWIARKPVNRKVEGIIHLVGMVLLFGFVILVDLLRLFG